ncbi:MAG: tetratricopeptide repeat protein [Candidatus Shapirobacteria bacterium]
MVISIVELHQKAERLREQDRLLEALKLYEEIVVGYQKNKNYSGLVESLGGRCLTYKHLFLLSGDFCFKNLAYYSALSSLDIAKYYKITDKIYRCYFRLGEMEILFENYKKAIEYYKKSLSLYPQEEAEKGDFQYHLGEAQCLRGDTKNGLENLSSGLTKIRQYRDSTDSFLVNVWESGCLMKLYIFTKDKNYLEDAQKIIDSDSRLIIRKRQIAALL